MNKVLEVNREELWARVQPGLVQDELNHHVRSDGLPLRPGHLDLEPGHARRHDAATTPAARTPSPTGSPSITSSRSDALLADGSRVVFGEVTPGAVRGQDAARPGWRAQIYREVARHPRRSTRTRSARATRSTGAGSAGYNLDELVAACGRTPTRAAATAGAAAQHGAAGRRLRGHARSPWSRRRCAWCGGPRPPRST